MLIAVGAFGGDYAPSEIVSGAAAVAVEYGVEITQRKEVGLAISNSFGFGGHNSILAFKKYPD